ncbi:MAG: polyketide synthase dehydratase domain-containing protein [Deltaproteobacteria bacterium]
MKKKERYPVEIRVYPYLQDHCFEGQVVFPAVEALIVMATVAAANYPQINVCHQRQARFPRFLSIDHQEQVKKIFTDITEAADGSLSVSIKSMVKAKTGTISRMVEHAYVEFAVSPVLEGSVPPLADFQHFGGKLFNVPSEVIYRDLVPFGKAYQNITGELTMLPEGAIAHLYGGEGEANDDLIGSPFPLDAALHAACTWGQRYAGLVAFPVGFAERKIYRKTKKGREYFCKIIPVNNSRESLIFDALIYDLDGMMYEKISGIQMRDVSQGRRKPPDWIKADL